MSWSNDGRFFFFPPAPLQPLPQNGLQPRPQFGGLTQQAQYQQYRWYGPPTPHPPPLHPLPGAWRRPDVAQGWPHRLMIDLPERQGEDDTSRPPPPPQATAPWSNLNANAQSFAPKNAQSTYRERSSSGGVRLDVNADIPPPPFALPAPPYLPPGQGFTPINFGALPIRQQNNFSTQPGPHYRVPQQRAPGAAPKTPPAKQATPTRSSPPKRPKPSANYLLRSTQSGTDPSPCPRTLLVILDLNGTLLFRTGRKGGIKFDARPQVDNFLRYLFENHHVMIWSSAMPANVKGMCSRLLTDEQQDKLVACWARDTLRLSKENYVSKVQVYKQLEWVWTDQLINSDKHWDQTNTVLIDDSKLKAVSAPFNLVEIEEFEGRADQMHTDVLGQVVDYLEVLRHVTNVSMEIRKRPFVYDPEKKFSWDNVETSVV